MKRMLWNLIDRWLCCVYLGPTYDGALRHHPTCPRGGHDPKGRERMIRAWKREDA